ncbi:hypothetical protein KIN20_007379 [Parelaphostrongylus tenuis]|uniref:Uncharacterized protein n=1 Tax=Parelaphostrongylus tenuis TaxID=148309 RepID=A0AAD5QM01_PARTN|nr:hypothetical protein KIN20_007379 [Parelaphostrongylus tenuis]
MTTESRTTTTTLTSTSTKKRKTSIEKKVQHISPKKNVEAIERSATEQNNTNTCQITKKEAESKGIPGSTTSVKKNIVKEESVRSIGEKERIEEENKDSMKKKRTTRSALVKSADKVTIGESSKSDGKPTKLTLTGAKDVTVNVSEISEIGSDPHGKPIEKIETTVIEKIKTGLMLRKIKNEILFYRQHQLRSRQSHLKHQTFQMRI